MLPYSEAPPSAYPEPLLSSSPRPPLSCLLILPRKQPPPLLLGVRAIPTGLFGLLPPSVPALLRPIKLACC
jgi:hypothetical protein